MRLDSYHPLIGCLFFVVVLVCAALFDHPAYAGIGLACAFAYAVKLRGRKALALNAIALVIGAVWGVFFAATTHFGVTDIGTTLAGNAVTWESACCGAVQGVRIAAVLMWLSCLLQVCTADKVVYLAGRVWPRLSTGIAILLRAVPRANAQRRALAAAQGGVGSGPGQGGPWHRMRTAAHRAGALADWMTDGFFQASQSMRARGSALRGRTAYALYRFDNRDRSVVIALVLLGTAVGVAAALDQTSIQYAPEIVFGRLTPASYVFMGAYAAFCLLPFGLQTAGERRFARAVETVGADARPHCE
ncbi:MAG: energy-coupling factor transporter transmembrane component T [Eggerthellaceae bacterium]|jgi:energy-coupling factor transport system permease protein